MCRWYDDNGNVIEQATLRRRHPERWWRRNWLRGSCVPCFEGWILVEPYTQQDIKGRQGINTVFSRKWRCEKIISIWFQIGLHGWPFSGNPGSLSRCIRCSFGVSLDYEPNILGLDAASFTTVLAQFDALQVAPNAPDLLWWYQCAYREEPFRWRNRHSLTLMFGVQTELTFWR